MSKRKIINLIQSKRNSLKNYVNFDDIQIYVKKIEKIKTENLLEPSFKAIIKKMFLAFINQSTAPQKSVLNVLELYLLSQITNSRNDTFINIHSDDISQINVFCKKYHINHHQLCKCITNVIKSAGITFPYKKFFILDTTGLSKIPIVFCVYAK